MSPTLGKTSFTPEELSTLRADVLAIIDTEELTRQKVADECGIPAGTFGPFLNDKYAGDNENVGSRVWRWLKARQDQSAASFSAIMKPTFQHTRTAARFLSVLEHAQFTGDLIVIGAGPGTGKTASAEQHRATRPRVHMATMKPSTRGVNTALVALLQAMGESDAKGTPQALSHRIAVRVREPGALIIIDEAQHLSEQAVDEFRSIHDETGVGLAFIGDERVFALFDGSRKAGFAQFSSRIGMRAKQAKPVAEDVKILAAAHGITDEVMIKLLQAIAHKPGALRGMTKALMMARRMAAGEAKALTPTHIREAWNMLAPDVAV